MVVRWFLPGWCLLVWSYLLWSDQNTPSNNPTTAHFASEEDRFTLQPPFYKKKQWNNIKRKPVEMWNLDNYTHEGGFNAIITAECNCNLPALQEAVYGTVLCTDCQHYFHWWNCWKWVDAIMEGHTMDIWLRTCHTLKSLRQTYVSFCSFFTIVSFHSSHLRFISSVFHFFTFIN